MPSKSNGKAYRRGRKRFTMVLAGHKAAYTRQRARLAHMQTMLEGKRVIPMDVYDRQCSEIKRLNGLLGAARRELERVEDGVASVPVSDKVALHRIQRPKGIISRLLSWS